MKTTPKQIQAQQAFSRQLAVQNSMRAVNLSNYFWEQKQANTYVGGTQLTQPETYQNVIESENAIAGGDAAGEQAKLFSSLSRISSSEIATATIARLNDN